MNSRIFVGVEHKYRRLSALFLERRRGQATQFVERLCRVEIRCDGGERCQLQDELPEPPRRLILAAAGRHLAWPAPGGETGAESLSPGGGATALCAGQRGARRLQRRREYRRSCLRRVPGQQSPARPRLPRLLSQNKIGGNPRRPFQMRPRKMRASQ